MKIQANGISINYQLTGTGECLTLIHGAGDNLNMWYHQVPAFSQRCQVLIYDVRGFGQTESPESEYSMELFAEDLYQLLKALGIGQSCVLGYSMGGRIALELTLRHPEVVKALILANSGVGGPRTLQGEGRLRGILELLEKGDMTTLAEELTVMAFSPGFKEKNPQEFGRYKAVKLENDPQGFARVMRAMIAAAPPADPGQVRCPTLIIVGEHEGGAERAKASQEAIPGSQVRILPTGHGSAVEAPQAFNTVVLEFLASLPR